MKKIQVRIQSLVFIFVFCITALTLNSSAFAEDAFCQSGATITPCKWHVDLTAYSRNSAACGDAFPLDCHFSSPVLADINADGRLDVVVATNEGWVLVFKHDGSLLWSRDIAPAFGMPAQSHEIQSSPAVGDIDNDGRLEIVVGAGTHANSCHPPHKGGVIALEHDGTVKTGWPKITDDYDTGDGNGCPDSVFGSPSLANLDSDPQLEIIVGAFDKRVYAWNHDGTLLAGFPPSSAHYYRTGQPVYYQRLADLIWSSPAIADLDRDGQQDIIIGTDEGSYNGVNGWHCPYTMELPGWPSNYCGGSLYAFKRDGSILAGFPKYLLEQIQSTPAIANVSGDSYPEIFVGMGDYFYKYGNPAPTDGFRLYGFDHQGNNLAGWPTQLLSGITRTSPALGDIAGDSKPEIIIATSPYVPGQNNSYNPQLYAFYTNGQLVSGFPVALEHFDNGVGRNFDINISNHAILGDFDGDEKMEIFVNTVNSVTVIDGNGSYLTSLNYPGNSKPIYYAIKPLLNSPALGDLDSDGRLELVVFNSSLYVFDLNNASNEADWPMFKQNSQRTSSTVPALPSMAVAPDLIVAFHQTGEQGDEEGSFVITNTGSGAINWSVTEGSNDLAVLPNAGTLQSGQSATISVEIGTRRRAEGTHDLGNIQITASSALGQVAGSPAQIPVTLFVGDISHAFMPMIRK